jgi:hypothetical protein
MAWFSFSSKTSEIDKYVKSAQKMSAKEAARVEKAKAARDAKKSGR